MTETLKILMLGEGGVGKSSILFRYFDGKFSQNIQATLGVEFKQQKIRIENREIQIQVWDTAGQERFKTITPIYYRNVQGVAVVYSMSDKKSFHQVRNWLDDLKELSDFNQLSIIIVANKCDMSAKEVTLEEGQDLAKEYNLKYYESSAKTGYNVKEMFLDLAKQILAKKTNRQINSGMKINNKNNNNNNNNNQQQPEENKDCC